MVDRKELLRQYKETPRPMGVFRVRNTAVSKSYVGTSVNLPGMLNRMRFQLENGAHPSRELQADWNDLEPEAFVFEVLDELEPSEDPAFEPAADLAELAEMWTERLRAEGERFYR